MLRDKHVVTPSLAPSKTATSLLLASTSARRFSSSCTALDALLTPINTIGFDQSPHPPSGLAQAAVLELLGPPGIGKTRSAMSFILGERFNAVLDGQESSEPPSRHVLVVGESKTELVRNTHTHADLASEFRR